MPVQYGDKRSNTQKQAVEALGYQAEDRRFDSADSGGCAV
jgi:hypothetical protein